MTSGHRKTPLEDDYNNPLDVPSEKEHVDMARYAMLVRAVNTQISALVVVERDFIMYTVESALSGLESAKYKQEIVSDRLERVFRGLFDAVFDLNAHIISKTQSEVLHEVSSTDLERMGTGTENG